jgi:hypothetical protein
MDSVDAVRLLFFGSFLPFKTATTTRRVKLYQLKKMKTIYIKNISDTVI